MGPMVHQALAEATIMSKRTPRFRTRRAGYSSAVTPARATAPGRMIRRLAVAIMALLLLLGGVVPLRAEDVKTVTIYPSYGYRAGAQWAIPLRLWVHEPRSLTNNLITHLVARPERHSTDEIARAHHRLSDLVADDESGEQVALGFDEDPRQIAYQLLDAQGRPLSSDLNGLIEGTLRLDVERSEELLRAQRSTQGWLRLRARSPGHQGNGRVRLLASQGRSVISDIDDTIKITGIPAGQEVVLENTFFRPFVAAPGMAQRYRTLGAATAFHYVSGSPWGLYRPLAEFITAAGYPAGSFHMKSVRKNLLTAGAWQDIARLAGGEATRVQKLAQIGAIIGQFPARRFILVGDSGEQDPEIYRAIRQRFPRQIEAIWIRDVVDDRVLHPERLAGMAVIEGAACRPGSDPAQASDDQSKAGQPEPGPFLDPLVGLYSDVHTLLGFLKNLFLGSGDMVFGQPARCGGGKLGAAVRGKDDRVAVLQPIYPASISGSFWSLRPIVWV
ncbi:Uncharacterized conserved protein (DUF2183) [Thiorhodovibrio frisius]|uniref:Uncharacterized conserved protein (DUF2183) n=2 Tax=Thiorhodovibrio frisius TaxID=631362 RepID=H8Z2E6_9GAMM|nr:Uncharacterized conserved protein (DUF2183) [Thiorhodovibrio frisius]WPL21568.1 hypothetical protein Thiofri_01694 [Thiorhodovibrio frisius]